MAGAYPRDTDSIFGHAFLVYAPAGNSSSFLSWTTVNFAADTQSVKWYELYPKGISGGLSAYYFIVPLHEKLNEYRNSETRDIRFFPVKISEAELARFKENLDKVKDVAIPYKFFVYNCAHGTYQLLYDSLDNLPEPTNGLMAPLDLVNILYDANRLEEPFIMEPLLHRIRNAADQEYAELEFLEWKNKQPMAQYNEKREKRMAELRHSMAQREVKRPELFLSDEKWKKPHGYSRIELGSLFKDNTPWGHIGFRPLLHDQTDNQHFYSGTSSLSLFNTNLIFTKDKIDLHKIDFFHARSTEIHDKWFRSMSFNVYAGYKNKETRFELGLGKSFYIIPQNKIAIELLLFDSLRNGNNYIGLQTNLVKHTKTRLRYGLNYEHLHKGFSDKKNLTLSSWISLDINTQYNLYIENTVENSWRNPKTKSFTIAGMRYYF